MTYKQFIQSIELLQNKDSFSSKLMFLKHKKKKNRISLGYHEYDKEEIRLEQFNGVCVKVKTKGVNTKLILQSQFGKEQVVLNFFLFNPFLFDIMNHDAYLNNSFSKSIDKHTNYVNYNFFNKLKKIR